MAALPRIRAEVAANHHRVSSLSLFEILMLMRQMEAGIEYVVEKRVSDDLVLSDIRDLRFAELPWPCGSVEFYFEDPAIPTVMLQRRAPGDLKTELAKFPGGALRDVVAYPALMVRMMVQEQNAPMAVQLNLPAEEMDAFALDGHEVGKLEENAEETALTGGENLGMKELALLAYKVMLYASIPELAPKPVGKGALHHGGKPDVKNRPRRPIYHVVDMPLQYRESPHRMEGTATKDFNGRRGHFHHYRSERFVNRKGERDYFPPIYGPDGTLPRIRCRVKKHEKPDQSASEPAGVLVGI